MKPTKANIKIVHETIRRVAKVRYPKNATAPSKVLKMEQGLPCVICAAATGSVVDNFCADCRHVHFRAHDCAFAH